MIGGAESAMDEAEIPAPSIKSLWEWNYDELDDDFKTNYLLPVLEDNTYFYPPKLLVSNLHDNIDGEYKYNTSGSGGMIYDNYDTPDQITKVLKITEYRPENEMEVFLQKKAGKYAPEIYYDKLINKLPNKHVFLSKEDIDTHIVDLPDNVDVNDVISKLTTIQNKPVFVIIMEYLSAPSWIPIHKLLIHKLLIESDIAFYAAILRDNITDLVNNLKIYNTVDFVGYTGDHLFFNRELNQFKFIDYGLYSEIKETDDSEEIIEKMLEDVSDKYPQFEFI
jgi:hypothetical protein